MGPPARPRRPRHTKRRPKGESQLWSGRSGRVSGSRITRLTSCRNGGHDVAHFRGQPGAVPVHQIFQQGQRIGGRGINHCGARAYTNGCPSGARPCRRRPGRPRWRCERPESSRQTGRPCSPRSITSSTCRAPISVIAASSGVRPSSSGWGVLKNRRARLPPRAMPPRPWRTRAPASPSSGCGRRSGDHVADRSLWARSDTSAGCSPAASPRAHQGVERGPRQPRRDCPVQVRPRFDPTAEHATSPHDLGNSAGWHHAKLLGSLEA